MLKAYRPFQQESVQKIFHIYQSLNNTKHQVDSCLNQLTKPDVVSGLFHETIN